MGEEVQPHVEIVTEFMEEIGEEVVEDVAPVDSAGAMDRAVADAAVSEPRMGVFLGIRAAA